MAKSNYLYKQNRKESLWKHLMDSYNKCSGASTSTLGLSILPRLKYKHLYTIYA